MQISHQNDIVSIVVVQQLLELRESFRSELPRIPQSPTRRYPVHLEAPPSPDYVPGPEEPEQAPLSPEFVHELVYPEFMPPEDEVFPVEEQPLPADVLPTADSPGYIADSDPKEDEEDPEEDPIDYPADGGDDDDDDDESSDDDEDDDDDVKENEEEEEEEEHITTRNFHQCNFHYDIYKDHFHGKFFALFHANYVS
ncbi:hypothetical protein Tco_1407920 [Tanacetum coccineum]